MKVMVLAAGRGERMRPLTDTTPKPLAPLSNGCLIDPLLHSLYHAGAQEIVINVCHLADQIINYLGDGSRYGLKIIYSQEEIVGGLETGGGVYQALPLLGNQPFLVVNADIITDFPFQSLLNKPLAGLAHLVMVDNPYFHQEGDFYLHQGKVSEECVSFRKLTFAGISVLDPQLFKNCHAEKFPLNKVFKEAMQLQAVTGEHYQGEWHNIGTMNQLQQLPAQLLSFLLTAR